MSSVVVLSDGMFSIRQIQAQTPLGGLSLHYLHRTGKLLVFNLSR